MLRRVAVTVAGIACLASTFAYAGSTPATAAPAPNAANPPLTQDYVDRVNDTLRRGVDHWGERVLNATDGPTLKNVQDLLVPANLANDFLTDSAWIYLPLTYPKPNPDTWIAQRAFALHVVDGSQIITNWAEQDAHQPRRHAKFKVGGEEVYGSEIRRLDDPTLAGGYLPVVANRYTDAQGTRWDRESFVTRINNQLVSLVKFTAFGAAATSLKVALTGTGVSTATITGGNLVANGATTHLAFLGGGSASWAGANLTIPVQATSAGASVYLVVPNVPANLGTFTFGPTPYVQAKNVIATYWNKELAAGAKVEVPEPYAMNAMRNLLIQNLVMGWQQSIGNGYEGKTDDFAFVPEVSASVQVLGEFGYTDDYRKSIQQILRRGQGSGFFPNWEMGIKLQSAASHYFLTGDSSYVLDNLATFEGYRNQFATQRDADPHGLLAKNRYGSDIPAPVYGIHHQTEGWRGLRDMGLALQRMGATATANLFLTEANELGQALRSAIASSQTWLPDGSLYVPISLLDPTAAKAYEHVPDSTDGSYWNLTIGYFLATGLWAPNSAEAKGLAKYLYSRGALFLGLTRFNLTGTGPGVCWVGGSHFGVGPPGYKTDGVDEQYGYSRAKFLADAGEADRLVLNFYGKLAHDLTPNTFIGGEGATIAACPELNEYYRTQFYPPLSANNATYLEALRGMLVREDLAANGLPSKLHLTPATPRGWLADGKRIAVTELPTKFGPVSYAIQSDLDAQTITAEITPPPADTGSVQPASVILTLRTPAGHKLSAVTVDGQSRSFSGETIDLGPITATVSVRASYQVVAVPGNDQADPTIVTPNRKLFQPGQQVPFNVTVETLGTGTVDGSLSVNVPSGWTAPSAKAFSVASNGKIAWTKVTTNLTIPSNASVGEHTLSFVATPSSGPPITRAVKIEVARPVAESYADLVKGDGTTGYWRLGETSGGTVADSSQYGTTGTLRDSVQLGQPGAIKDDANRAVQLSGGFIELPDVPPVTPTTVPSSFEGWFMTRTGRQQGLMEKYDAPALNGFVVRIADRNALRFELLNGSGSVVTVTGKQTVLPGEWHHVVATFDGSTKRIYLNGKLEAEVASTALPTDGTATLKLGARGDDANLRLDGWMDEVAIYNHALTPTEVKDHFVKGVLGTRAP